MKWCFLIAYNPGFMEFLGKLAHQVVKEGDSCLLVFASKIAEHSQKQYFPKDAKSVSKIDWCIKNYTKNQIDFNDLSWKEFFGDYERFRLYKMNFNYIVETISQEYQFIDFILREEKPDVVIHEPPSGTVSEIFYHLCQKYNIPYLGLLYSKIGGKIEVRDLKYTCSKYEKTFREIDSISEDEKISAKAFIRDFLTHKEVPLYVQPEKIYRKEINIWQSYIRKSIKMWPFWLKYILKRKYFKPFDYRSEIQLKRRFSYPLHALKVRLKRIFQKNIYSSSNEKDKFFLFPLQYQPEASTLVSATYFYDQLNTIKNIAFSLPFLYKLYVKEHPKVKSDRPWNFYEKLKQIPNVVLISPFEKVENLIKRSQGVITLTSTIGLEAALSGKPVYVLGNVFYSYHPLCQKVKSFEELKEKIKTDLIQKPFLADLEEINLRFVTSYFRNIISGDIGGAISKEDTNDYQLIYKEIKRLFLC